MSGIHETAYPRLKSDFSERELVAIYTPTAEERVFVRSHYRQSTHRAYVLIQLKLLQRLGYFVPLSSLPVILIEHICSSADLRVPSKVELARYNQSGSKSLHRQRLRVFVGIRVFDAEGERWLTEQALQVAQTKQELPDIINVLIEALIQ